MKFFDFSRLRFRSSFHFALVLGLSLGVLSCSTLRSRQDEANSSKVASQPPSRNPNLLSSDNKDRDPENNPADDNENEEDGSEIAAYKNAEIEAENELNRESTDASEKELHQVLDEIQSTRDRFKEVLNFPASENQRVLAWIHYFTVRDRDRFQRFLNNGARIRTRVEEILKSHGVPVEIYYLGLIESGFQVRAKSSAKALGVWQFMKGTASLYGLKGDSWSFDERRDPLRATDAAARFLSDLHDKFGSWFLALAAYNAGPGRVSRAMRLGRTRDYFELCHRGLLPKETLNYVPKFIAAMTVGKNLRNYGFREFSPQPMPEMAKLKVPARSRLSDLARITGIREASIREMNPHLAFGIVPPLRTGYDVWLPRADAQKFKTHPLIRTLKPAVIPAFRPAPRPVQRAVAISKRGRLLAQALAASQNDLTHYRVRKGDSLEDIARRFGTSVHQLK